MIQLSVVMSVYNGEKFLSEAVSSILNQTLRDFEFIIIDDGSTDKSLEILNKFAGVDERIKLISWENKGLIYSLNEGVKMAQGEYIARMDADDISIPNRLEKQLKYAQEKGLAVCGTWASMINEDGEDIGIMDYPPSVKGIKSYTLSHNPFIHSSVIFRKDVFEKVGGYNKRFKYIEDYELWSRIVFKYKTSNIQESLLKYRKHDKQITRRNNVEMRLKGIIVRLLILYRFLFGY